MEKMSTKPLFTWLFVALAVLFFIFLALLIMLPALREMQNMVYEREFWLALRARDAADLFIEKNIFILDQTTGSDLQAGAKKDLGDILSEFKANKSDLLYIVDNDGILIIHPDLSLMSGPVSLRESSVVSAVLKSGETNGLEIKSDKFFDGRQVLVSSAKLSSAPWRVVVESPSADALRVRDRVVVFAIILIISGAVILILLLRNTASLLALSKELSLERDHVASVINSLTFGIIEHDHKFRVFLMNRKAEEIIGLGFEKVKSVDLASVLDPRFANLQKILSFDEKKERRLILDSIGGDKIYLEISALSTERANGGTMIKILRDISRDVALTKIKSEFISVVAHQLRMPLAAIKWAVKVMLEGEIGALYPTQKEYLDKAYASVERMNTLISDLLDVSRIEEGRFGYEFKEASFEEILAETLKDSELLIKTKRIKIELREPNEKINRFTFDPQRLKVALSNLLENAFNYTPPGGLIKIEYAKKGIFLEFSISDNGIGIPAIQQPRIFTKFFRAENAVRMQTEGSGLGLFITKNIVKRHGGDIRFSSKENEGSTFTFTLPLKKEYIPDGEELARDSFLEAI